jgi:peptidoglycan-associated lipoprotein
LSASLLLETAGCADQQAAPPVQAPRFATAEVKPAPNPAPAATGTASPNLSVSEEIAASCKLKFNDIDYAPKFDFDQSALWSQDTNVLSQIAKCVTTGPLAGRTIDLVGRADPRGESDYNMALGDRRANSVREYLAGLGVDDAKLFENSRGSLDATGTDELGWQRDRRVDVLLH